MRHFPALKVAWPIGREPCQTRDRIRPLNGTSNARVDRNNYWNDFGLTPIARLRQSQQTKMFRTMALSNVQLGTDTVLTHPDLVNLYGCSIGDGTKIGPFVEIQKNSHVGARCKISSHSFICEGVTIEDEVFIGHGVMFTNELFPRACTPGGGLKTEADWSVVTTRIRHGASVGSNATIICGITVGRFALVGAGAVVTRDVPDYAIVAGVPAKVVGDARDRESLSPPATGMSAP